MAEPYITITHVSTQEIAHIFKAIQVDPSTACWVWTRTKAGDGYGSHRFRGKRIYMHRFMYAWLIGPVPADWREFQIDHLCRNTACCNPLHLELVTRAENVRRQKNIQEMLNKTCCPQGHPYTGDNLVLNAAGHRACRTCKNARQTTAEARAKKRAWRAANIEKVRAQSLATYHRHAEANKQRMREAYRRRRAQSVSESD